MVSPAALTAVIRASRPEFRSAEDKLVFAVHAALSVEGLSLRKLGPEVDEAAAAGPSALPAEEVPTDGWNASPDLYSFLYTTEQHHPPAAAGVAGSAGGSGAAAAAPPPLLVAKCLPMDGSLLVTLADAAGGREPVTVELPVARYVPEPPAAGAPPGAGYAHLDELGARVVEALQAALEGAAGSSTSGAAQQPAAGTRSTPAGRQQPGSKDAQQQERERQRERERSPERADPLRADPLRVDPLRDDRYPGNRPMGRYPPGMVPPVGGGDRFPGGMGGDPFGPLGGVPMGGEGGMMVGPNHPYFADRLRHPGRGPGMLPGGGPPGPVPGARWDPISPPGLEGWAPEDYQRRHLRDEALNDIGRPPPGRGTDWDNMFG